jgi:glycosyltransferase involved in cell wall biosynthesis
LSTNYANLCDRVVVPSESIQTLIRQRGVTVPTTVIPTGVDVAGFSKGDGRSFRQRHAIPQDAFVIGHLGRLAPEKNLAYLAAAVARTLKKNRKAWFLVVGDGPSRQAIEQIFVESEQHGRLVLPGKVTGQTLVDAYHAMDLFVFASHTETQGMVLIEAMAAGVPVLALDAPGVREVVDNGVNGCLLDGDASSDQFADVLHGAVDAPEKIMAWGQAARRTATAFGRDRSAEQMLRLYAHAVSTKMEKGNFNDSNLDVWDKFLLACQAEWDLVAGKTESILQTVSDNEKVTGLDETA